MIFLTDWQLRGAIRKRKIQHNCGPFNHQMPYWIQWCHLISLEILIASTIRLSNFDNRNAWTGHPLTHWGRATHICVNKLTNIASDNGLSPGRRQAIIWNNAGILSIGLLGTNFSEILIEILTSSFKKMRLKVSSAKWRPFCLGLNVLKK